MIVDVRFQDGTTLVKEGAMFIDGGDIRRTSLSEGDLYRGGLRALFWYHIICTHVETKVG